MVVFGPEVMVHVPESPYSSLSEDMNLKPGCLLAAMVVVGGGGRRRKSFLA